MLLSCPGGTLLSRGRGWCAARNGVSKSMSVSEAGPLVAPQHSAVELPLPHRADRGHPRRVSLRAMLLTLLVALLVATVASIGAVQWITSVRSIQDLQGRSFRMLATTITSQVQSFLEPGMLVLEEAATRAQYGRLVPEDSETLANYLVDRLRFQ